MRVGLGLAVGGTLLALGLRVYNNRRAFAPVLLGGGIGTLCITGFAAFQLCRLAPYLLTFAFMVVVALLACSLSLRHEASSLGHRLPGKVRQPFLLYDDSGSLGRLILYTRLILAGRAAVYSNKVGLSLLIV